MFAKSKPKNVVGLDIGSHTVKVVEIKESPEGKELAGFALTEIAPGSSGGEDAGTEAIKRVMGESKIETDRVVTAVSGQSVIVRHIELPKMSREEAENAIKYEAEQHIPFDIKEVTLDFQILEHASDSKKMNVLLVAARNDLIDNHLKLIQSAGLKPAIIDVDSFALVNTLEAIKGERNKEETIALVNMGAKLTNINIVREGVSCFTRDISLAGNNLTEAIQNSLNLDPSQAEKLKKEEGEAGGDSPVSQALNPVLKDLVSELRLSFDYYENQALERTTNRILFSGGSARLKNLDKFLTQALGIPTEIWNFLDGLGINSDIDKETLTDAVPLLAVGIGLALRRVS